MTLWHVQAILDAMASLLNVNNTSVKLIVARADCILIQTVQTEGNLTLGLVGRKVRPGPNALWGEGGSFLMWQAIISSIRTHPVTCGTAVGRKPTQICPSRA